MISVRNLRRRLADGAILIPSVPAALVRESAEICILTHVRAVAEVVLRWGQLSKTTRIDRQIWIKFGLY